MKASVASERPGDAEASIAAVTVERGSEKLRDDRDGEPDLPVRKKSAGDGERRSEAEVGRHPPEGENESQESCRSDQGRNSKGRVAILPRNLLDSRADVEPDAYFHLRRS